MPILGPAPRRRRTVVVVVVADMLALESIDEVIKERRIITPKKLTYIDTNLR